MRAWGISQLIDGSTVAVTLTVISIHSVTHVGVIVKDLTTVLEMQEAVVLFLDKILFELIGPHLYIFVMGYWCSLLG